MYVLIILTTTLAVPAAEDSHIHVVDPLMTGIGGAVVRFKGNGEAIGHTDIYGRLDFTAELDATGNISRLATDTREFTGPPSIPELVLRVESSGYEERTVTLDWQKDADVLQRGFCVSLWTTDYARIADRIVTNPSHFAVALKYDPERMPTAFVLAKAADAEVQQLLQTASCVQTVSSPKLARALYLEVDVGEYVPPKFNQEVQQAFAQPTVTLRPTRPPPQNVPGQTPAIRSQPLSERVRTVYYPVHHYYPVPVVPPQPPPYKCCLLRLFDDLSGDALAQNPQTDYRVPQPMADVAGGGVHQTARPPAQAGQPTGQFLYRPYQSQPHAASGYPFDQGPQTQRSTAAERQPVRYDVYFQQQLEANWATERAATGGTATLRAGPSYSPPAR